MRLKRHSLAVIVAGLFVSAALLQPACAFATEVYAAGEAVPSTTPLVEDETLLSDEGEQGVVIPSKRLGRGNPNHT